MKRSRVIAIVISLTLLIGICLSLTLTASAATGDWIDEGNSSNDYAYSFAIVGDTQSLSISDAQNYGKEGYVPRVNQIYDWLVANKDEKNIQLVMGLGDIVETWQSPQDWQDDKYSGYWDIHNLEWDLTKAQIAKLAGNIPFTLVRGNHDSDKAFAEEIGSFDAYTSQLLSNGGFYTDKDGNVKYDTSYMKLELGEQKKTKWLVIQLDWAVTTAELDWAAELIAANRDHSVILTMHNYLYNDASVDGKTGSQASATPNPNWDYSIDPTSKELDPDLVFNPEGIWHRLVSKHENIKLVISGHIPNSNVQTSQLVGDNGNTVTQMLVDPQSMDLESANPGGCGMVCMLYFREDGTLAGSWDEETVDVEWYSTIKNKYHKEENQFTLNLELYEGGVKTDYGYIPAEYADAEAYPFVSFAYDVDINEYFFTGAYANWTTAEGGGAYPSLSKFSGKKGVEMTVLLRRDFTMANDTAYSNFGNISVTLNLDLGGHTFASDYNESAKKDMSIFQTNLKKNLKTTINVYGKEGSALLNGSKWTGMVVLGAASANASGAEFTYNFNGIKIGYAEGSESTKFVIQTYDGSAGNTTVVNQNINFNNCTFDLITNKPSGSCDMFLLAEKVSSTVADARASVTVNGGNIIASSMSGISIAKMNSTDSLTFGKGADGKYTAFTLSAGAAAPTEIYKSTDGKVLEYVRVADGAYELCEVTAVTDRVIDVWLIAGQSNAAGYGSDGLTDAKYDPRYQNGFENILYYGIGDSNVYNTFVPLTVGMGNKATSVGAEVGIAKMLGDSNTVNAVIKLGYGSTPLYPTTATTASTTYGTWTSPTYIANNNIDVNGTKIGALYNDFVATVTSAIELLRAEGYTPVIRGMWWMQGEAECSQEAQALAYEALLSALITDLRRDLGTATGLDTANMPFVAGNIYRNGTKDANGNYIYSQPAYLATVNAAQASVAQKLDNVYTVATAGLPQVDNWHFTADAQQYLGMEFVKAVVSASGKYSVYIDGSATSGTGFGSYAPGERVSITLSGIGGWVLKEAYLDVNGSASSLDVAGGVCTYTFTMPSANVSIKTAAEDPGALSTKYGSIPSAYSDAEKYPFVLFKNGEFVKAYEQWNDILDTGNQIFLTDPTDGRAATILMRRDYNTTEMGDSKNSQNLYTIAGHIDLDLGGKTLTRGKNHLFQVMAKSATAKAVATSFTVYNGTILAANNAPLVINTNGSAGANDHFYFTFEGVSFGFASGASSTRLVFETYANGTFDTIVTATFNGCTFNAKANAPAKSLVLFDLDEESGSVKSAGVTVNGGKMIAADLASTQIYVLGSTDTFSFGKGAAGTYTALNLGVSTTISTSYSAAEGGYLSFGAPVSESDGTYTYTLGGKNGENAGGYGIIDSDAYPASEYPFALFGKQADGSYILLGVYKHYYDFLLDLRFNAPTTESVLYLRADYRISTESGDAKDVTVDGTSYKNNDRNFYYLKAPLTIDLNGKTLTRHNLHSLQIMGNGVNVTINVKNGTLHTETGTMIPFNNTGAKAETVTLNFEGVTFTSANVQYPWIDSYTGGSEGTLTTAYVTFTDCTFDISTLSRTSAAKATLFDLKDDKDWININVTVIGGKFIAGEGGFTNVNLYTVNSGKDSFTFKKNASGSYTSFEVVKGTAAPSYTFISGEAGAPAISLFSDFSVYTAATSDKTHNVYFLDETVRISEYNVPASLTGYTFLVFDKNMSAFAGYNTWYEIWYNIWTLREAKDIVVLMLADYDTDACSANSQDVFAAPNMVIDLNGHTLTRGNRHMFQLYEKGSNAIYAPCITVKNGTLQAKKNYGTMLYFNGSNTASGIDLTFTFVFDNVTFTSTEGYTGRLVAETHATNGVSGIKASLTFNGCDFIVNDKMDTMFTLNEQSGKFATEVVINGGSITFNKSVPIALINGNDSLTFGKYNGSYTEFYAKSGVNAPTDTYLTDNGTECILTEAGERDGYVSYKLYPKVLADYRIQTSITLYSNFVYNIYLPKDALSSFTVNGTEMPYSEIELDGVIYYHVAVVLAADQSLDDIKVTVTLDKDGAVASASWTLNVHRYVSAVIGGEYDAVTKALMKDMLTYAYAAHTYFGNKLDADTAEKITSILSGYERELPTGEAKRPAGNTYFTDVAIYLGGVPSFRFYLASGYSASDFTFTVGGRAATVKEGEGYVEITMYAYMMLDDVSYTVTDKTTGDAVTESYNIYSYYEYAKSLNDASLLLTVEALMKYSASASDYRASVIGIA